MKLHGITRTIRQVLEESGILVMEGAKQGVYPCRVNHSTLGYRVTSMALAAGGRHMVLRPCAIDVLLTLHS